MKPLPPKQAAFVREYLVDLNASAAMRRAGYRSKNPDVDAAKLLVKPSIKEQIQYAMNERAERTQITADQVLKNIVEIGQRCMEKDPVFIGRGKERKIMTTYVTDPDTGEEILAQVFQFDSQGALKAQELLGKHLKLFTDKTEVTGKDGSPLQTVVVIEGKPSGK